jgi:hypothetical protein
MQIVFLRQECGVRLQFSIVNKCSVAGVEVFVVPNLIEKSSPPQVDHLDVSRGLTPSMNGNQEFTSPRTRELDRAVAWDLCSC